MKILLIILLNLFNLAHANLPDLFGASAANMSVGSQANSDSAANNYYAPSLLSFSKETRFSFDVFYVHTNFKEINNVVIENDVTTVNSNKSGDVKVNQTPSAHFGAHLSTPIFSPDGVKLNLSVYAPFDRLLEGNTGDQYKPRYVMYDSQFIRPIIHLNLSHQVKDWGFALGAQTGTQTNGDAVFITKTESGTNSLGKISYNAKPSLALIASIAKKWDEKQISYFTFNQEMKSNFKSKAMGETDISGSGTFPFDFDLDSTMFFDPMIIRAGHQFLTTAHQIFFSVEFQKWDNYEGSHLRIKKRGGSLNGSHNYESIDSKNIFIPKIGYRRDINDRWSGSMGYFYRPSPINSNTLKNAGNSIDTDKHVASIGATYKIPVSKKIINLDFGYQAHFLKSSRITKTDDQEDGQSGGKIGSPGYKIGGMIHALSTGISWMY